MHEVNPQDLHVLEKTNLAINLQSQLFCFHRPGGCDPSNFPYFPFWVLNDLCAPICIPSNMSKILQR